MGLGAGAASTAACSSVPREEGAGGDGAGGEDGSGLTTTHTSTVNSSGSAPSTTPSTTSYPSAVSTYGVGPSGCDTEPDCSACQTCAFDADCSAEAADCTAEPECLSLNECTNACAAYDDACIQACVDANPNGVDPLSALIDCVYCDACYVTCDGISGAC